MNYLTQSNAPAYEGRHISCSRPRFHYYPLRVFQAGNGIYYVADRNGVAYAVPTEKEGSHGERIPFDVVE